MKSELTPAMSLAISVIKRCVAGDCVPLVEKALRDYQPTPHRCHDNVREWVALYPKYQQVRGFLVANQAETDTSLVIAHSVVKDTDGTLCDITPTDAFFRYPFVTHLGSLEEFNLIAAQEPFMLELPNALLRKLGVV